MGVVPDKINDRIQWFEQRMTGWIANAAAIGVPPAQATSFKTLVQAARAKFDSAHAARQASKDATVGLSIALHDMDDLGADLVKTIRAFAETTNNPSVFVTASVPPPAEPTPAGPPTPPEALTADPSADGSVTLKWKGSTASQTFFTVWRKVSSAPAASFTQIGSVAAKTFTDTAVPSAVAGVTYTVRAQRGTAISAPSDEVTVNFGGGQMAQAA